MSGLTTGKADGVQKGTDPPLSENELGRLAEGGLFDHESVFYRR